jgi:hypothetical protein
MEFRTCTFIHDDGNICNSAAVTDRNLCFYHLDHRARLMRMAQYRARGERFNLTLPPLESMHAVQSALTQLSEALAADMIELKRADRLIRVLNLASRNLLKADKWPASPYHSDQPAPAVNLTANYGLPNDLNLNTPPDLAFPPEHDFELSSRAQAAASAAGVEGPAFPVGRSELSPMPTVDYCKHGPGCPEHTIRADYPETPELAELREIQQTQGMDAATERYKQQQRNRHRRHIVTDRKRYAAIALEKNLRLAAERLAEQKLAERKPPASVATGETIAPTEEATA